MGTKYSDLTGLYECIKHPDRLSPQQECISAKRDGIPNQICTCCEECRQICFVTPHGHGGTSAEEWEGNFCKICGKDVSEWIK